MKRNNRQELVHETHLECCKLLFSVLEWSAEDVFYEQQRRHDRCSADGMMSGQGARLDEEEP
jgi:hypothetical protein